MKLELDPDQIIPNASLSINEGAVKASGWSTLDDNSIARMYFNALAEKYDFSLDAPVKELPKRALDVILYGTKGEKLNLHWKRRPCGRKLRSA